MQPAKKSLPTDVFLKEHLLFVITKAEAGEYADAMTALQETLTSAKDNVYVRAVERQLTSLLDLSRRNVLTDERKAEILDPITSIVERLISSPTLDAGIRAGNHGAPASQPDKALSLQEKVTALDHIKVNYFERAGQHLTNGDYDMALAEIRRVFVIEPENATAKQYESVILELMRLKGAPPQVMRPTINARSGVPGPISHRAPVIFPSPSQPIRQSAEIPPADMPVPAPPLSPEPGAQAPAITEEKVLPFDSDFVFTANRSPLEDAEPKPLRPRRVAVIAAALFVMGAGVAGYVFMQVNGEPASPEGTTGTIAATAATQDKSADNAQVVATSNTGQLKTSEPSARIEPRPASKTADQNRSSSSQEPAPERNNSVALESTRHTPVHIQQSDVAPVGDEVTPPAPSTTTAGTPNPQTTASETSSVTLNEPSPEVFVAYEKEPQVVELARPEIPDNAWQGATVKRLVVRIMIDAEGKPHRVIFLKGDIQPVENAVTAAMMKSTFTPGIMGKAAVTTWLTVPINIRRGN